MIKPKPPTGTQIQDQLIELGQTLGWRVAHFKPARLQSGNWVTPFTADGKGFPDLVMVKDGKILAWECKSTYEKVKPDQMLWLEAFATIEACDSRIVRPTDVDECIKILEGK